MPHSLQNSQENEFTIATHGDGLSLPMRASDNLVGKTLGEKYAITALIGTGGMCSVYRATELGIGRQVAIKLLLPRLQGEQKSFQRFQQEAIATSKLQHPNIAQLYYFGIHDQQHPYIVMEYIEGCSLSDMLKEKTVLSIDQTIALTMQVLEGLSEAHAKQIIHRDLKPSNIMLVAKTLHPLQVKIVDFGIAKIVSDEAHQHPQLTQTGDIFGSPLYMSPEQCDGRAVDRRSDLYSVGCIMYECLTGSPPHLGKNAVETMFRQKEQTALSMREATMGHEFPEDLEGMVAKLLCKDPEGRYQTAPELSYSLERFLAGYQPDLSGPAYKPGADFLTDMGVMRSERFQRIDLNALPESDVQSDSESRSAMKILFVLLLAGLAIVPLGLFVASILLPNHETHPPLTASTPISMDLKAYKEASEHVNNFNNEEAQNQLGLTRAEERKISSLADDIVELDLDGCHMAAQYYDLSRFRSLGYLNLHGSDFPMKDFAMLAKLPLKTLDLDGLRLSDSNLQLLRKLPTLSILNLRNCGITDSQLKLLNRNIVELDLSWNPITDKGLQTLAEMPKLKRLVFCSAKVMRDKHLVSFQRLKNLEYLDLRGAASFSPESIRKLNEALPNCAVIASPVKVVYEEKD